MSSFSRNLNRFHRRWSLGRVIFAVVVLACLLALGLLLHGWMDFQWALSSAVRSKVNFAIYSLLAIVGLVALYRIFKTTRTESAAMADQKLSDPRQRVLAAASLQKLKAETEMEQFHLDRALDDASSELGKLPTGSQMPFRSIGFAMLALLLVSGVIWGLQKAAPEPFRVTAARVLDPSSDIPPYSPLVFTVTPEAPRAVYGGEAVVGVTITGGEIKEDVYCLIRNIATGKTEQVTAYRESKNSFARKFENALAPVEFAFVTGRARSSWYTMDVLMQPKVSGATVTVVPPAYTGKSTETYPLESDVIKVLEGSSVTLELESNRPLSGGKLELKPMDKRGESRPEIVEADTARDHSVSFSWVAHKSSKLMATIQDVRSTPSAKPLELTVKAVPDQAPVVDLSAPEQMVLATPKTVLPFFGQVQDDHGLSKVSLVRALLGYRDRSRVLADALVKQAYDFKEPLKLGELGVEAGQLLEFYLEAMDRNPSLLGVGVSDVVRVKIISEDEYGQRIRARTELKHFTARYRALAEAIAESRKALEKLDEAADLGKKEDFEKARKEAEAAHAKAEALAKKIAEDFMAFAMEKRLAEIAEQAAQTLSENKADLAKLDFSKGEAAARGAIAEMQKRLGAQEKQAKQVQQDAEVVKKMGKVMQMAGQYRKIYRAQKSLVERMGVIAREIAKGNTTNSGQLKNLARLQEENRQALLDLAKELKKRADALPPGFEQMQQDVAEFLQGLEELDIQNPMQAAADAAKKGKSIDASANALLALSLMEQLINKPNNGF